MKNPPPTLSMRDPNEPGEGKSSTNSATNIIDGEDRLETVLSAVGFGLWHVPLVLVAIFVQLAGGLHILATPLYTAPLPFYCSTTTNNNASTHLNDSVYDNQCLKGTVEGVDLTGDGPPSCPLPHYNTSLFSSTVTSQWHLLCERESLRPVFQALLDLGNAVGTLIGGHLSDSLGRRSTIRLGAMLGFPACLIMAASPWYPLVLAMRVVMGVVDLLMLLPIFTLLMETCPPRIRVFVTISTGVSYGFSLTGIASLSYRVREWQQLLYFAAIPSGILFFLVLLINESPRWLILRRKWDKASHLLTRASRVNKSPPSIILDSYIQELKMMESSSHQNECSDHQMENSNDQKEISNYQRENSSHQIESTNLPIDNSNHQRENSNHQEENSGLQINSTPHVGLLDEVKKCMASKTLLRILLAASLLSFCNRLLSLGVPLNANNFAKFDPRLYLIIIGLADGAAVFIALWATYYLGRRRAVMAAQLLTATMMAVDMAIPQYLVWGRWGLMVTASFLSMSVFSICLIYFVELVPTVIRSRGLTILDLLGVLGELCVPFITDNLATLAWWSVDTCFLLAAVAGAVGAFMLPETKNLPLPDTIQEVEDREKIKRSRGPHAAKDIEDLFRSEHDNSTHDQNPRTAKDIEDLFEYGQDNPTQGRSPVTAMEVEDPRSSSPTIALLTAMEVDDLNSSRLNYATYTSNPQTARQLDDIRRPESTTSLLTAKKFDELVRTEPAKSLFAAKKLDDLCRAEPSTSLLAAKEVRTRSRPSPAKPPRLVKDSTNLLTSNHQQPSNTYQAINNTT